MLRKTLSCSPLVLAGVLLTLPVAADTLTIRRPGAHPNYHLEAEPHVVFGALPAPGPARNAGLGLGFRGAVELIDNGFISKLNNTIAVGFGVDWVHYGDSDLPCEKDPNSNSCRDLNPDYSVNYLYLPIVMQWNFWLSRDWSVFGEPGLAMHFASRGEDKVAIDPFVLFVGGRYHLNDQVSLTMRVGYPTFSFGVSFLL